MAGGETGSTTLAGRPVVEVDVTKEVIINKIEAMEMATVAAPATEATSRLLFLRNHGNRRHHRRLATPGSASACLHPPLLPTSVGAATAKDTETRDTGVRATETTTIRPLRRSMVVTRVATKEEVIREATARLRVTVRTGVTTAGTGVTIARGITAIREGIEDRQ